MLKELVLEKINHFSQLTIEECNKLCKMGFKEVTNVKDVLIREENKDLIRQYELLYPQNPFLTEFTIREILVENEMLSFDSNRNFGYSIPYKNCMDILNFKIKEEFKDGGEWLGDGNPMCYFYILAPRTMFINRATTTYNPDPVVFHQVKGGYLMVTSWGEESNLIKNPNIN